MSLIEMFLYFLPFGGVFLLGNYAIITDFDYDFDYLENAEPYGSP